MFIDHKSLGGMAIGCHVRRSEWSGQALLRRQYLSKDLK